MTSSFNRTIGSAWSTLHSFMNFSFAGFTNEEIYGPKWRIIPRTFSTTISVDPEYIHEILYHVGAMYGPPLNRGKCGRIFKSSNPMATITIYTSTSVISVQGSQHKAWVESVLPEIDARIDSESSLHHSSAVCESVSIPMDSDDDELVLPSPITSTPKPTEKSSTVSIGTQTYSLTVTVPTIYVQSDAECQTDSSQTSTCSASTATEDNLPSTDSQHQISDQLPDDEIDSSCQESPAADNIFIPTIPTDNLFSMLRVEETPAEQQVSHAPKKVRVRPTPKPRTKIPPIPKPRNNIPVATPHATTKSSSSSSSKSPDLRKRTVLIIGDSIPKHLDGRKMSKRCKVINRCIPGSNLELWTKLAPIFVKEEQATCVIIHCATNNISNCYVNECVDLCECLVSVILSVDSTISIGFSSLTTQRHYSHRIWIREFNARIKDMCRDNKLTFIDNSNIELKHLARDGLHLRSGIPVLAKNFISFIHDYCLSNSQDFQKLSLHWKKT